MVAALGFLVYLLISCSAEWEVIPTLVLEFRNRYGDRQKFVRNVEERIRHLQMRQALQRRLSWERSKIRRTSGRAD